MPHWGDSGFPKKLPTSALLDWPRSGLVRTVAIFGDRSKSPDRTVRRTGTAVRTEKYGPVWEKRSGLKLENGD
jgi:hypothetical protein